MLHRGACQAQRLALVDKEPVGVTRARRPEMATDEPGGPEDDSAVARDRTCHRRRQSPPRRSADPSTSSCSKSSSSAAERSCRGQSSDRTTARVTSASPHRDRASVMNITEYVRNLDQSSFQMPSACMGRPGPGRPINSPSPRPEAPQEPSTNPTPSRERKKATCHVS